MAFARDRVELLCKSAVSVGLAVGVPGPTAAPSKDTPVPATRPRFWREGGERASPLVDEGGGSSALSLRRPSSTSLAASSRPLEGRCTHEKVPKLEGRMLVFGTMRGEWDGPAAGDTGDVGEKEAEEEQKRGDARGGIVRCASVLDDALSLSSEG